MPFKCVVHPDKSLTFSGKSRVKFWQKDQWGDWEYLEQEFIESMGFEWIGYDGEEGRGLWGGPIWTDGNLYWTFPQYAIYSFLDNLREGRPVDCELSEWEEAHNNVRWIFEDWYAANCYLKENLIGYHYSMFSDADTLDLAQKLSDWEFENARS